MADKEERIVIIQWNIKHDICPAPTEYQCGTSKSCDDCKVGMSRQEAIEKMAKILCQWDTETNDCTECCNENNKNACRCIWTDEGYIARAEAVLDALIK